MAEPISIESGTAAKENRISFFEHRNKIIGNFSLFLSFRIHFLQFLSLSSSMRFHLCYFYHHRHILIQTSANSS